MGDRRRATRHAGRARPWLALGVALAGLLPSSRGFCLWRPPVPTTSSPPPRLTLAAAAAAAPTGAAAATAAGAVTAVSTPPSSAASCTSSISPFLVRRRAWRLAPLRTPTASVAAAPASDSDVGNDPSGATLGAPQASPPLPPTGTGPNAKAIAALVFGELLLGALAFPLGHVMKVDPLGSIKAAFTAAATAAAGGLGAALLNTLGLSLLLTLPALVLHKVSGETIEDMLRESLDSIFGTETSKKRPLLLVGISILLSLSAGVGEELLFRGALQPIVANLAFSNVVGVGASSLLFAVLHAATPRYLLLAGILSGYLGWIQIKFGNLLIPIVVHTLFDVGGFAVSVFWDKRKKDTKGPVGG